MCSRDFCRPVGQLYGTQDELADENDRIDALAAAARHQAARQARHREQPPGVTANAEETELAFTAMEAACPHCRKPVAAQHGDAARETNGYTAVTGSGFRALCHRRHREVLQRTGNSVVARLAEHRFVYWSIFC